MRLVNNKIKKITDHNHIVFTSNCTTAIFLLLKALNLKKKKIIIPINICFDVILSIFYSGNIPLIIDTNKNLGLSYSDLKKKLIIILILVQLFFLIYTEIVTIF